MATFTPSSINKRSRKIAKQADTFGSIFTRSFSYVTPAGTGATDTAELTNVVLPANCVILGVYAKSSIAGAANSGFTLKGTTDSNVFVAAANANNVTTTWAAQTLVAANCINANDQTVTVAYSGANAANAAAITTDITIQMMALGGESTGTYTTFTQ